MLLGYIRVSTLEQAMSDKTSLQEQERVIRGLAMAQGVTQYDLQIYKDAGVSGSVPLKDRPEGGKLYADAKKGDVVVASKLDRMFRDALDAQYVYHVFKQRGVDLILFDFGAESIMTGIMAKCMFSVVSAFADLERGRIAERMLDGKRAKKEKGGHTGGPAPYGFAKVGEGRAAMLIPNEPEQKLLDDLSKLKDYYLCDITREINARGYRNRAGNLFDNKTISRLLPADARVKVEEGFKKPNAYFGSFAARNSLHAVV